MAGDPNFSGTGRRAYRLSNFAGGIGVTEFSPILIQGGEWHPSTYRCALRSTMVRESPNLEGGYGQRGTIHSIGGRRIVGQDYRAIPPRGGALPVEDPGLEVRGIHLNYDDTPSNVPATNDLLCIAGGRLYYMHLNDADPVWTLQPSWVNLGGTSFPLVFAEDCEPVFFTAITAGFRRVYFYAAPPPGTGGNSNRWFRFWRPGATGPPGPVVPPVVDNVFIAGSEPPPRASIVWQRGERTFCNNLDDGDQVRYCNNSIDGGADNWGGMTAGVPDNSSLIEPGFGGKITAGYVLDGDTYVAKQRGIWQVRDIATTSVVIKRVVSHMGFTWPNTVKVYKGQAAIGMFNGRLWRHSGGRSVAALGESSLPIVKASLVKNPLRPKAFLWEGSDEYHLSVKTAEDQSADLTPRGGVSLVDDGVYLVYDIPSGKFTKNHANDAFSCATYVPLAHPDNKYGVTDDSVLLGVQSRALGTTGQPGSYVSCLNDQSRFDLFDEDKGAADGYLVRWQSPFFHVGRPGCDLNVSALHILHRTRGRHVAKVVKAQICYDNRDFRDLRFKGKVATAAGTPTVPPVYFALGHETLEEPPTTATRLDDFSGVVFDTRLELPVINPEERNKGLLFSIILEWQLIGHTPGPITPLIRRSIVAEVDILNIVPEVESLRIQ